MVTKAKVDGKIRGLARGSSVVEAVTTGARKRIENGFRMPPVNQSKLVNCRRSNPS